MTGSRGPRSKDSALRQSPADRKKGRVKMEAPKADAPDLYEMVPKPLPATVKWWETWLASPQTEHFAATDWLRLWMLAPLVQAFFEKPNYSIMAEIRQNEAKLGATSADRDRLGWRIDPPEGESDAEGGEPAKPSRPDPRTSAKASTGL